jgi:5-methylthioadenosine/S-adenosylhomocysteine deaminase
MRAVVVRGMTDREDAATPADFVERIEDVVQDLNRLEREYDSNRICISAESSILRGTERAIVAMRDWAVERGKLWHTHLAQTRRERDEALTRFGMGNVQYAEKLGLLGPDLLAVHCSGLLDGEAALLGKYGVRIAHCPLTIMRGGDKVPPIWKLQELGAVVGVGTDGSATNNGQNPWESMKMAVYMQRVRFADRYLGTAEEGLEMMTVKAAEALAMADRIGSLEPGKEADVALFRRDQLHLVPDAMLVNNLVYSGLNNMADTVLVGGDVVLEAGQSTVFDEEEVVELARRAQREMVEEAGLEEEIGLTSSWPVTTASPF